MWNTISNSLLFYSQDFYNTNIYKNKKFIKQIYFYYKNKGFRNIILTHITNIIISIFLFVLILFLFNSIDYHHLFSVNENRKLSKFINLNNLFKLNPFFVCTLISFIIFITTKILNLLEIIYIYKKIKNFYNKNLQISDEELKYMSWGNVIKKFENYTNEPINIYKINSIILFYENYLNYLITNKIINISHLTNLMEWNIQYCILFEIFNEEDQNINLEQKKKSVYNRIKAIAICNFIFMPFILVFILFYNIFNYGEQFYNHPSMLTNRDFTKNAQWKYRYYNELLHDYTERLDKIKPLCDKYTNMFKNDYIAFISNIIIFMLSSFFVILVFLSLVNDKILIFVTVFNNKSIFWIIGILASIITILKNSNQKEQEPRVVMRKISNELYLDSDFVENSNSIDIKNKFIKDYQYKIVIILKDIVYTILTPFRLWLLSKDIDKIVYMVDKNISKNDSLNVCCKADFNDDLFTKFVNNGYSYDKTIKSLEYFSELNEEWYTYMINKINGLTNEVTVNVI